MRYSGVPLLALALTLAGCGWAEVEEKIDARKETTDHRFELAKQPAPQIKHQPLTVTDEVWYGTKSVRLREGLPLPAAQESDRAVALVSTAPLSLQTIANQISIQTNIPVRLADGAASPISPTTRETAAPAAEGGAPAPTALPTIIGGPGESEPLPGLPVAYEGPLSGLLDMVASNFGIRWRYDGAAIVFSRYETRTFTVEALPGEQSIEDGLSADDSGGTSSSGEGEQASANVRQDATLGVQLRFWEEFATAIETLLSDDGAYTISPSSGTVTVIATPERMTRLAEFIQGENRRLGKQVAINVEIYSLSIDNLDQFGLDLDLVFKNAADWPTLGFGGVAPPGIAKASSTVANTFAGSFFDAAVVNAPPGTALSQFNGSDAVVQALSQVGDVTRVAQVPLVTLNNRPATRQVVVNRSYIREVNTTVDEGVTTTEVTPGNIQTGITLQLVPRMLPDGRMLLQYSLSLRDLIALRDIQAGGSEDESVQIQLPETQARVFVQQAMLKSGSTLVLAGFDQDDVDRSQSGTGHPANWLLGGGQNTRQNRQAIVVAITASEIAVEKAEGY